VADGGGAATEGSDEVTTTIETSVREAPIIFTGANPVLVREGRKTQTRRVMKPQPADPTSLLKVFTDGYRWATEDRYFKCPHPVGSRMWVKEGWSPDHAAFYPHFPVVYRADADITPNDIEGGTVESPEAGRRFPFKWRSPMFMPRSVCRTVLEVTEVRVQKVQDITEADARAEGVASVAEFAARWDALHAKKGNGWDKSPRCWAYTFRVVSPSPRRG
jgi:hypothetical protein